jgi:hypothetical protein
MKPHKYAEIIKAWADGAQIQWRDPKYDEFGWEDIKEPSWLTFLEYRIKPEEKKPVVRWLWAYKTPTGWVSTSTFCTEGEAGHSKHERFKLEYTRTEFPE